MATHQDARPSEDPLPPGPSDDPVDGSAGEVTAAPGDEAEAPEDDFLIQESPEPVPSAEEPVEPVEPVEEADAEPAAEETDVQDVLVEGEPLPEEEPAPSIPPVPVPLSLRHTSAGLPVPLTTRQNLASMTARRLTQQVRVETAAAPAPLVVRTTTHHPPFHPPAAAHVPPPAPVPPPSKGLKPSWGLVAGAAALGLVFGFILLGATSLRGTFGLVKKSQSETRLENVLEVDRYEISKMLNKTYVLNLKEEMRKYRGKNGLPAPEARSPSDLAEEAAKAREETQSAKR